jgi:hypothetical protein
MGRVRRPSLRVKHVDMVRTLKYIKEQGAQDIETVGRNDQDSKLSPRFE